MNDHEFEKYKIARVVARWILEGQKGIEKPEVQKWLKENGYDYLLPKNLAEENSEELKK